MDSFNMQKIVNRLHEIENWIRENGFSNRGAPGASPNLDAEKLEKALTTLLNAHDTLARWERFYMSLFIEKALKENPHLAYVYPGQVKKYKGGWMNYSELESFYRTVEKYINSK